MALTVTKALNDVLLCGVDDYMELTTDSVTLVAGVAAVNTLNFGFGLSVGHRFTLKWLGNTHEFTVVASPSNANELPPFSSDAEFAIFAHQLESNFYVFADFTMAITSASAPFALTLTAREVGERFNLDTVVSGFVTLTTPGTDAVYASNFSVIGNLYAEIDGTLELVTPIDATPDDDGKVRLYIGEVLKALITPTLPMTSITGTGTDKHIRELQGALLHYRMLYYEQYGSPPQVSIPYEWGAVDNLKEALALGLPKLEIPNNTAYNDYCVKLSDRKLLRNNYVRRLKPNSVDFLQVYADINDTEQLNWNVNYIWAEGGSTNQVPTFGYVTGDSSTGARVYECAVSYESLKTFADLQNKTILEVQVYAFGQISGTDLVSVNQRYTIDNEWSEFTHWFLFLNSKGGWETVYFTGHLRRTKAYERVEAQLVGKDDYIKIDSEIYTYNHKVTCGFEMSTGLLYPDEVANLDELANSSHVYILDGVWGDSQAFWRPIVLDPSAFTELESTEGGLESKKFSFKNAIVSGC